MVLATLSKNSQISLEPISSKKEIELRLFFGQLEPFQVQVLQEILNSSLKIPLSDLADNLGITEKKLEPALDFFSKAGLFTRKNDALFVDKEKRKLFESQMAKFDEDFEPGIQYLQTVLNKVPLERVFDWYQLGKTTTNLLQSLIERIFQTPRLYERYLAELQFQDPVCRAIFAEMMASPELEISCAAVRKKHKLSPEKFEEIALLLELHLAAFVRYKKEGNVLQPLAEWREFKLNLKNKLPKPLKASSVKACKAQKADLELYRRGIIQHVKASTVDAVERSIREIEKGLKVVENCGWVLFEDFIKCFSGQVGRAEEVRLEKAGVRWRYKLPVYTAAEIDFIETVIFELLVCAGCTSIGDVKGGRCFQAHLHH